MEVCPVCGSGSLTYAGTSRGWTFPGVHTAERYICKNCGYEGGVVITVKSKKDIEKIRKHGEWLRKSGKIDHKVITQPIFSKKWIWFWRSIIISTVIIIVILIFLTVFK